MKIFSLILLILITLSCTKQNSDGFLRVEGQEIVNDKGSFLIKSIGTGNWMIQEGYMMQSTRVGIGTHTEFRTKLEETMGVEKTKAYYKHWLKNHFTKSDLDSMKAWGFNALRPALHYKWFTLPIEEELIKGEHTWNEMGFQLLDDLLMWAEENEMYIMLDMHGAPGGQGKNKNINDYNENLPSLFESIENQDKLVALWEKLAERYKDNPWFGGYDLINEPNWKLDDKGNKNGCGVENNDSLWDLQLRITKAIRAVDKKHIIYISGNCWGNNYNSFDSHPLNNYDENTVITFHRYWNHNDLASIQWALDMREQYNRPLWMSESGENSNQWFADAIHLLESTNIGWSWWPVKKSRMNNVFKVTTPESYKRLLNSWSDGATPLNADDTYNAMIDYSNAHKTENTTIAYDVIYAMLNNRDTTQTQPFKNHQIGEWIQLVDYDLGRDGHAYHDEVSENIHTGDVRFRAWNNGNHYRNDGVDIGMNEDDFYVSWTKPGEWLQFTLNIPEEASYTLHVQSASSASFGTLDIFINDKKPDNQILLPITKSEHDWKESIIKDVKLPSGEVAIRFEISSGKPNLKSFKIEK